MENTLISNKLPLPRYYDGQNWNTVLRPTRKSIPKYLHQDLPELKLIQLKQQFKQMGKFNCPKLQYFESYIKKRINKNKKKEDKQKKKSSTARQSYQQAKQQLQYALITCQKGSSIIDQLIDKAKNLEQKQSRQKKTHIKTNSLSLAKRQKNRYFEGTMDLVFRNRKNLLVSQLKKRNQFTELPQIERAVNSINLIQFDD